MKLGFVVWTEIKGKGTVVPVLTKYHAMKTYERVEVSFTCS
jgi:hypothetical protein